MKRSEWSDEQLEKVLQQMPQMKDERNPQEIYQNISAKMQKRRRPSWLVPCVATIAAIILITIISPSLMNEMKSTSDIAFEENTMSGDESQAESDTGMMSMTRDEESIKVEEENSKESQSNLGVVTDSQPSFVINEDDIGDQTLLTFTVPIDYGQFFSTVSILTNNDGRSSIQKYNEYIPLLNNLLSEKYKNWGLETYALDYLTYTEEIENDETKNVVVDIPSNLNISNFSSAESGVFNHTIDNTFRWLREGYSKVIYKLDGKVGTVIGQSGVVSEGITIEKNTKKGYFIYKNEGSDTPFFAYSVDPYDTIEEAFEAMKQIENLGDYSINPSIPEDWTFTLTPDEKAKHLTISITAPVENREEHILALEAMMLTAKEFDFETVTVIADIDKVGRIDIGTPIPVPVSLNPIDSLN
ncbi:hypothetical protein [Bacillus sp. PS06]|uniref:hypothetical protein n=1 Tax=Bacillus sp. PS06 TaxID=2764176 RepID=UPI0017820498|nr:hypothetical protein [Bacillus sp. PS06]MBD8070293.1 hypothetical protein [Bacillus sp. PS06]